MQRIQFPGYLPLILTLFGCPFANVFMAQSLLTRVSDPTNPLVTFNNTAANYKGCAWIDLDRDNWPDAFMSQKFLFKNLGNGQFETLSELNGATLGQAASGSSWGDLDNDGDLDCISASTVSGLHINSGDNTFELKNQLLPEFTDYRAWDCALADADNNGRLDLFFTHADGFPPGSVQQPCKFYLQNLDGSFSLVSGYEFSSQFQPFTIPIWTDYDLDGDVDLFIGSGPGGAPGPDFCYRNMLKETGVFSLQRINSAPFNSMQDGQVYNAIDYDNDGDLDLCLTNYAGAKTRFYVNNQGVYTETNTPFTIQSQSLTNAWGDLDNDGDLDVLITRDASTNISFYRNQGSSFDPEKIAGTVPANTNACGIALGDYDNDGDLDLLVNGATTGRSLFRNDSLSQGRHWVQFSLQGVSSNRSAIGAIIRLKANLNGVERWQLREVSAHNSFQSQHDLRQHFGLNYTTTIDSLVVSWPSGMVQSFSGLASDLFYNLVEGQAIQPLVSTEQPEAPVNFEIYPNPFKETFSIISEKEIQGIEMFDSTGKIIPLKFINQEKEAQIIVPGSLLNGAYFVRIQLNTGQSGVKKVLIVK